MPGGFRAPSFPARRVTGRSKSDVGAHEQLQWSCGSARCQGRTCLHGYTLRPQSRAIPVANEPNVEDSRWRCISFFWVCADWHLLSILYEWNEPSEQTCSVAHPCYGSDPSLPVGRGPTPATLSRFHGDKYGGGFYIQGDASITLIATGGDGTSNATQTYQISQSGTTTTIVVDSTAATTTVTSGGTTMSLQGFPRS